VNRAEIIDLLVEQARSVSHRGRLDDPDVVMPGGNPDCGDVVTVFLKVDREHDRVEAASFVGEGCTISQAAASVLMEQVQGIPLSSIEAMDGSDLMDTLGRDVVRMRPRCATLALSTLKGAVKQCRREQERERPASRTGEDAGRDAARG
jgi:nitrogen fixation NifU-like protein